MALSLYDATVPYFQQILGGVSGILQKAEAFCAEKGIPPSDMLQSRLTEDMLPLAYQVKSTAVHSIGAIEGIKRGVFGPDMTTPPNSFSELGQKVTDARNALEALSPAEINELEGHDMRFEFKERRMFFTADKFLLTFSMPNFYFHATTAYDLVRSKGAPIGKMDFLGQMLLKK